MAWSMPSVVLGHFEMLLAYFRISMTSCKTILLKIANARNHRESWVFFLISSLSLLYYWVGTRVFIGVQSTITKVVGIVFTLNRKFTCLCPFFWVTWVTAKQQWLNNCGWKAWFFFFLVTISIFQRYRFLLLGASSSLLSFADLPLSFIMHTWSSNHWTFSLPHWPPWNYPFSM